MIQACRPSNSIRMGFSRRQDAAEAVAELADQINGSDRTGMIFFFSPGYDLGVLGRKIADRFDCPVMGCSSTGEWLGSEGWMEGSIVGMSLGGPHRLEQPTLIRNLRQLSGRFDASGMDLKPLPEGSDSSNSAVILLVDGLSKMEEVAASAVHAALPNIPLAGGSAAPGLELDQCYFYHDGAFHTDSAAVGVLHTGGGCKVFQSCHYVPTESKLVITEADCKTRTVHEIDGLPAADAYAQALGIAVDKLDDSVFAFNPVMLRIGGNHYIRAVHRVGPDQSLQFHCAVDAGLVLTLGRPECLVTSLRHTLDDLKDQLPQLSGILAFDCITRKLGMLKRNQSAEAHAVAQQFPIVGFSTFGEQIGGVHMNYTLTGIALGDGHG